MAGNGGGRRRALTIGVSAFDREHDDLPFAGDLVPSLAATLDELGFETTAVTGQTLKSTDLGALVHTELAGLGPDDTLLVHVVSHGHTKYDMPNAPVYVLGSDGTPDSGSDVGKWLADVQFIDGRPLTLFLLDLCFAGKLARLPWQSEVDSTGARAWVIAACSAGQAAYDGRFTQATTNVLRALNAGELDVDPADPHIPLSTVARTIHQEVNLLTGDGINQQVTASLVDISVDPRPPFFRNPAYTVGGRVQLRAHLDPGLLPFLDDLDEGLDARHFLERAAGIGRLAEHTGGLIGCFSGRKRELRTLSHWLNGDAPGALRVVTGSPGVGKSALLGVLVCAAHPKLRDATKPVWDRVEQAPARLPSLVAVHARRRNLESIVKSIAEQLGSKKAETAADLVKLAKKSTPVIVLDALDEADSPAEILRELLLPLLPVARLLVGVRDYTEFAPLLRAAEEADGLVDLDRVPADVLNEDLYHYVDDLLRAVPAYRDRRGGVSGAFADEVARVLSTSTGQWGPFLVAGLYTRQLITRHPDPRALDSDAAGRFGAQIPRDLPQVLELDLADRDDQPWLRPVLTALAHAKGQGMPISVLTRVASVFGDGVATAADIRAALTEAKFYLRQTTDTDRTTVHRLFHQGLVDHLAPVATDLVDALLAPLGPPTQRNWAAAEPYLFRHIVDHAEAAGRTTELTADLGFLLHPAATGANRDKSAIWSLIAELKQTTSEPITPAVLALAAARKGMPDLAHEAANQPGSSPLTWQPRWTAGQRPTADPDPAVQLLNSYRGGVRYLAVSPDGNSQSVASRDVLNTWDPTALRNTVRIANTGVGVSNSGQYAVLATPGQTRVIDLLWDRTVWINDTGFIANPTTAAVNDSGSTVVLVAGGAVYSVDKRRQTTLGSIDAGRPAAATTGFGTAVVAWAGPDTRVSMLMSGKKYVLGTGDSPAQAIAMTMDAATIAWCTEHSIEVWDRQTNRRRTLLWDIEPTAITLNDRDGLIAVGHRNGRVSLHRVDSGAVIADHRQHTTAVTAVAMSDDGTTVATADKRGRALVWRRTKSTAPKGFSAVTVVPKSKPRLAVVGEAKGFVQAITLTDGKPHGPAYEDANPVESIEVLRDGNRVLTQVNWRGGRTRLLDPVRGLLYGAGALAEAGSADQRQRVLVDNEPIEVTVNGGGTVELRSADSGAVLHRLPGGHHRTVTKLVCGPLANTPVACTGSLDGTVRVWDLRQRKLLDVLEFEGEVNDLDLSTNGYLLVCAGGELIAFQHISAARR